MPRAVITGAAGFLGSHLCDRLVADGWRVHGVDSLLTGTERNLDGLRAEPRFSFEEADTSEGISVANDVDWVFHLASPASPIDYLKYPIETLKVGALGTFAALEAARGAGAAFFLTSTSEVYGDPKVHPQPESYWGNVNPIGVRSVYDEAKRFAEAATMAYYRMHELDVRIVRIFNTYGPRLKRSDGRAVPTFIWQALSGSKVTVHGDGSQTRSLCYVDDLIEGFVRMLEGSLIGPVNLGNPDEITMRDLATVVCAAAGSDSEMVFEDRPLDDPEMRRPDITLAKRELGWEPVVPLEVGLKRTIEWARREWES